MRLRDVLIGVMATLVVTALAGVAVNYLTLEGQSAGDSGSSHLSWEPYLFVTDSGEEIKAELGKLLVPERHGAPKGRQIELAMVRFPSRGGSPGAPIVYLAGGPGGSGIRLARGPRGPLFQALRRYGDVIALDQRGTGMSQPRLDCPQPLDYPLDQQATRESMLRLLKSRSRECADHWRNQGVDLSAYNTNENADDLEFLKLALGVEKLRLVGMSYGTHLALATIRRHGESIERVVLAGVEGPDHTIKLPSAIRRQLDKVSRLIASDLRAGRILPDFGGLLERTALELQQRPVRVTTSAGRDAEDEQVTIVFGAFDLLNLAADFISRRRSIEQIPRSFGPIRNGDFSALASLVPQALRKIPLSAMGAVTDCASGVSEERWARIRREVEQSVIGDLMDFPMPQICGAWDFVDLGPSFREPVTSEVPILFISGDLDGRTPAENAEETRAGFPNSAHLIIENMGHEEGLFLGSPEILKDIGTFFTGTLPLSRRIPTSPLNFALPASPSSEKDGAASPILFRDVSLIDGTGGPLRQSVSVLVEDRRIRAIGSPESMDVPENVRVLDGSGKYLLPGFWDMHVHLSKIGPSALDLFVVNGVTSVRDMGSDFSEVSRWREEIVNGVRRGPRIKTPGPFLEEPANIERMKREGVVEPVERTRVGVPDPQSAERIVRALKQKGVDFLKIRTVASRETYLAIAKAAQEARLPLAGHVFHLEPEDAVRAKQRSIEHFFYPTLDNRSEEERNTLFNQLAENGTVIVPTLATWTTSILVPAKKLEELVEDTHGRLDKRRRTVSRRLIEDWREQVAERKEPSPFDWAEVFPSVLRDLREMRRAGVKILPGSDVAVVPVFPGFSLHEELELLVSKVGMTPMEALLSAHRQPAEFFGMQDDLGTVEVGKLADLVLLDDNPLQDIRNTRRIRAVVANGRLFRRADLDRMIASIEAEVAE